MQTEKVITHIVEWLEDYVEKSKTSGFVVGISGGIDSAVTSTLCAKTGLPLLCVEMPIHQEEKQVDRAHKHIEWLQNNFENVTRTQTDLTGVFDSFTEAIPATEKNQDLSLANTRARLRMTTLYYFAGINNLLVAGTGNKIEDFGVGFFTKYGDGGVDLSPIADLLKTEVYKLAKELNITKEIIDAKPTDGLFGDNRSDEDQLGASYPELEWAMKMDDLGKTIASFSGRKAEVFEIYKRLNRANLHKVKPIPVCNIPLYLKN